MDTTEASNIFIDLLGQGLLYEAGVAFGRGIAEALDERAAGHPYVGKRARFSPCGNDPAFTGEVAFVTETSSGPMVTLRLDDGSHETKYVGALTLLPEKSDPPASTETEWLPACEALSRSIVDGVTGTVDDPSTLTVLLTFLDKYPDALAYWEAVAPEHRQWPEYRGHLTVKAGGIIQGIPMVSGPRTEKSDA